MEGNGKNMVGDVWRESFDNYLDMNALTMLEVEDAKKKYNHLVMQDDKQANAILKLEIDELQRKIAELTKERNCFKKEYLSLKEDNEALKNKMVEFNDLVNQHLEKAIRRLSDSEKQNQTFIEKVVNNKLLRLSKRKLRELQHEIKKC